MALILTFIFITGLCIGSFLNVVILRALSNESIVFPASKCPQCQTPLKWWHNIPVVSYICLRGKCGFCEARISPQYPVIELITGIMFVLIAISYGFSLRTFIALGAASMLIVIAGTDIREKVVFTVHTYILAGLGLLNAILLTVFAGGFSWSSPIVLALLGVVAGIVIMEAAARLGYLLAGTRAFGEGDTFIAAALGALFGWQTLLHALVLSLAIQMVFTLPVFIRKLFVQKNYKTLIVTGAFFVCAIGFFFLRGIDIRVYAVASAFLAGLGIYLCKLILSGIKENPQGLTYLPFGPAMAIAGLVMLII